MKTILCPLEEIIFWNWDDFSKPIPEYTIDYFLQRINDTVYSTPNIKIHIVGTIFWEYLPEQFESKIHQINESLNINKIRFTLLLNADYKHKFGNLSNISNVVFINYFLLRTYWYTLKNADQQVNKSWNINSSRALFLTGKTNKLHRVGLLYKLYQQKDLLDNFVWSSFINTEKIYQDCKEIMKYYASSIADIQYTNKIFDKFVKDTNKSADNKINNIIGPEEHTFYSGFPYDPLIFSETKYSVISESYFSIFRNGGDNYNIPFITEKTWKTIVNYHPFIMVGMPNTNRKLEEYGFKVFDEIMEYPKYQSITDDIFQDQYKRIEVVVNNINTFSERLDDNKTMVMGYLEHNIQHFNKMVQLELNQLMSFISSNNITISINDFLYLINDTQNDKNEYHLLETR